jgi:SpoVK/Ycf46/Vps4 family AAA+-type ATPase
VLLHIPFEQPEAEARRQLWEIHMPQGMPLAGDIDLDILADRYELSGGQINNAVRVAVASAASRDGGERRVDQTLLEAGCESQLRASLESYTTVSTTRLTMDDVVLPEGPREEVEEFLAAIHNQSRVLNTWGMKDRLMTGKGLVALFHGPPGTGKTLCAEIIAASMGKPLHRVSLPDVVSKWVGETEKNIQQIFRRARASLAVLLFDEADALFASRSSEVRSSNDRYANMEVNLLLQELERFDGVTMLTSNKIGVMDPALLRRIQFRIELGEPDAHQRALIWKKLLSPRLPLGADVDLRALAERFPLSGARIKNALMRAAYLAAWKGTPVSQSLLVRAALSESKAAGHAAQDPEVARRVRDEWHERIAAEAPRKDGPGEVP